MAAPVIAFLSDYGLADGFAGICHAVIARGCPQARIIDLSHEIAPHDVGGGAVVLARAWPFLPDAAVVLADVDPGDAAPRRSVAVRAADGRALVGPDNGLLWPALRAAGGAAAVVDIGDSPLALHPISATFRGRDVLAPVAAGLAAGIDLTRVGTTTAPPELVALERSMAALRDGELVAHVVAVDRFGNLELDAHPGQLSDGLGLAPRGSVRLRTAADAAGLALVYGRTFGDVAAGEPVLYVDPQGVLALAVNRDSAAAHLGLRVGDALSLGPL